MRRNGCLSLGLVVVVACGGTPKPAPNPGPVEPGLDPTATPDEPAAEEPDDPDAGRRLRGPASEVTPHSLTIALPSLPSFELPASDPGFHTPRQLLVLGGAHLGTQVRVKGYVTWIYDCVADVQKPGMTVREARKAIEEDPTRCERPKLYLGDTPTTPPEASIWVVDVPRPPNKLEKKLLPRDELAKWPRVPKVKVGDFVAITGTWSIKSPHGEVNSDGLLVYAELAPAVAGPATGTLPPPPSSTVQPVAPGAPAPRAKVSRAERDASIAQLNACVGHYARKRFADAISECQGAATTWPDNHTAWYALGGAHAQLGGWADAVGAFARAVALEPAEPMYHMLHGIALYNAAIGDAREAQARREGRAPREVIPDLSTVDLDPALASLLLAVKLEPNLWNAHYHIGRIHRTRDRARDAADAFGRAIAKNPYESEPYVALCELYRRWGYVDAVIEVATLGTQHVPGARERARVWFQRGMGYLEKRLDDPALESFDRAIDDDTGFAPARFQRAQIYVRKREPERARRDLEVFLATARPGSFERGIVNRMLLSIDAKGP
jgi:tetratricopeptide (TPR) repeat protein